MSKETLKRNLQSLRAQLDDPISLDSETRQQLSEAADMIEKVLEEPDTDLQDAHASIEEIALGFEARHPVFARLLGEVTDALVKLGI
jgi:Domain of unknown function (DUF4404)